MFRNCLFCAVSALGTGLTVLLFVSPGPAGALDEKPPPLVSQIRRTAEAKVIRGEWGELHLYFEGEAYGVDRTLAATATIRPGQALHKVHEHEEEEFLVITAGSGVWHLGGKEIPLKEGDVLYVEPWVKHGFVNTGKTPLKFFVARWRGKGVKSPPRPEKR